MAVEAANLTLFSSQHLVNKQFMLIDAIDKQYSNGNVYNAQLGGYDTAMAMAMAQAQAHPLSVATSIAETQTLLPLCGSGFNDSISLDPFKADSGLTYSLPGSRKRSRDSSSVFPSLPFSSTLNMNRDPMDRCATFTFLGEDISSQIQQHQIEIGQFVARHTEKVRVDIEQRRNKISRRIIAALEEGVTQRLRAKEEEIAKLAKLNWALEEKIQSLCIENQIWRELAQTNEATANVLRSNLKQVLEQALQDDYQHHNATAGEDEEAHSCCESNNERTLAGYDSSSSNVSNRWCKNCEKEESCVLLLPCRHLCLCTVCASSVNICPICKSIKNISVHVLMS